MNWPLFAVACWLLAVLQTGLAPLLTLGGRLPGTGAQLLLVLAAFIPLCSQRFWEAVLAACLAGLLMDLLANPLPGVALMGPMALGTAVAACVLWMLKKSLLGTSALSLVLAVFVCGVVANAVAVGLLFFRGVNLPVAAAEPVPDLIVTHELFKRFIEVVCTTALALPVGFLMLLSLPLWGMGGKQVDRRFGQEE